MCEPRASSNKIVNSRLYYVLYCYTIIHGVVHRSCNTHSYTSSQRLLPFHIYVSMNRINCIVFLCCYNFMTLRFFGLLLISSYLIVYMYVMLLDDVEDRTKDCIISLKWAAEEFCVYKSRMRNRKKTYIQSSVRVNLSKNVIEVNAFWFNLMISVGFHVTVYV